MQDSRAAICAVVVKGSQEPPKAVCGLPCATGGGLGGVRPDYLSPRNDRMARTTTMAPMIQIMLFMA
jgi:hypothetical protein